MSLEQMMSAEWGNLVNYPQRQQQEVSWVNRVSAEMDGNRLRASGHSFLSGGQTGKPLLAADDEVNREGVWVGASRVWQDAWWAESAFAESLEKLCPIPIFVSISTLLINIDSTRLWSVMRAVKALFQKLAIELSGYILVCVQSYVKCKDIFLLCFYYCC